MATINTQTRLRIPYRGILEGTDYADIGADGLREAQNWIIRRGRFGVRPGLSFLSNARGGFDLSDFDIDDFDVEGLDFVLRPMGIVQYDHQDGATRTVVATRARWYRFDPGTLLWVDITEEGNELTGSATSHVVFKGFSKNGETLLIGVNGADPPKIWDGDADEYDDLGGSPPISRTIAMAANRVLLGNLISGDTQSPVAVDVSDFNDPESGWGSVQTTILAETPGEIVAMEELSALSVAIYKTDAIHVASAQGGIDPFSFELRRAGVSGPVSPNAVVKVSDGSHVYRALDGNLMRFDGMNVVSLGESTRFLFNKLAREAYLNRSFVVYDYRHNEVWTFFADKAVDGDPNCAIVDILSYDSQSVQSTWFMKWKRKRFSAGRVLRVETAVNIGEMIGTIGDQVQALGEFASRVDRMGICGINGRIYEDTGADDLGDSLETFFETGLFDMDFPGYKEVVETNHFFFHSDHPQIVHVRVGTSDDGSERVLIGDETFDVSEPGPYEVGHAADGRLVSLRIEADVSEQLQWRGAFVSMIPRGLR